MSIEQVQLYDDQLHFEANRVHGPFGEFADTTEPYENHGEPQYDFFDVPVYSPFGIASGPLPTTHHIDAALKKGFDIVTLKSVRTGNFPINPFPHVRPVVIHGDLDASGTMQVTVAKSHDQWLAVANSFGIPSLDPAEWQPYMRASLLLPKMGQVLLAGFQGTARGDGRDAFVADHLKGVDLIRETGANIIEINLSCPNEGAETLACFDTDITERIVTAVREANPDLKLIIKLAYFADPEQLKRLVKQVGGLLDGISAINTMATTVVDKNGNEVFPGRPKAGISGAPIKWAGLEMTRHLKEFREQFGHNYKILGMGGVLNPADFQAYRQAGADIVMSVTGAMWNPQLAAEIKQSL